MQCSGLVWRLRCWLFILPLTVEESIDK